MSKRLTRKHAAEGEHVRIPYKLISFEEPPRHGQIEQGGNDDCQHVCLRHSYTPQAGIGEQASLRLENLVSQAMTSFFLPLLRYDPGGRALGNHAAGRAG